ncbi:nucleoside phosphorylase domain-containing protein [Aspergillus cavernicola]|uniref:Nucleoside phosphorylase domain-containing protein n=1 Tax=Aspergillus cavernicola TaxID=176166 RepID=A0ABR4HBI3_9EURO
MRPKSRNDFAIAIICALPLEADAVEVLFDETYDRLGKYYGKQPGDVNMYINGRISKHHVVLCYLPGMGKGSAASVASSLRVSYTGIQLALVVGICGGAPPPPNYDEIFFGDIIISDTVMEYDFGRQYPGGFQRKSGVKDTLGRPDREIRTLLKSLQAYNSRIEFQDQVLQYLHMIQQAGTRWHHPDIDDVLFKASYLHKHHGETFSIKCCESDVPDYICHDALERNCEDLGCDNNQVIRRQKPIKAANISVHIGTVGSADTVMKSGQHRDAISRKEGVIGFEMEGAGVWDNVPSIIIKGVCDYADSHKSKSWQAYAAATGASAAKAFLEYWRPVSHDDASKNRHLMIPFGRNPRFVGRQDEIHKLDDLISMPDGAKKLAITGLGGVGKTQVALELVYRMRDREAECSIFWIPCTSYEAVEQAYMTIAQMIGIQDAKPAEVKDCIKDYFSQKDEKWLLVFDNADDLDMWTKGSSTAPPLNDFLPYNDQGHIIFTTRNRKLAVKLASADVIHIPKFDKETGLEFLEKSLIQKGLLNNAYASIALLEQLTFLPLAVAQAAAYINENSIGVSDYLLLLQEQEADVVELLSEDFGDEGRYKDMQNPVAMTWVISFCQVQKLDQLASNYLSLMACVDPRNIPQSFLPQSASKKKMIDALGLLSAYSFITIQLGSGSITLHRLVHLATRNWIKKEGQFLLYIRKAADRLSKTFPHDDHTNRQLWREYLPHALFLLEENEKCGDMLG